MTSKLYGVNATIMRFVFVLYCVVRRDYFERSWIVMRMPNMIAS